MPRTNDRLPRTNGETYFFRDHGQFDLLRLSLLPKLIERCRGTKCLRLWSAGCASGEEAYSLAMLVDSLLPERDGWDILILGSDIDPAALTKARGGRYGQWSFRMAPPTLQQRHFRRDGAEWVLDERIRRMVSFRAVDLIGEAFPTGDLRDMDLILCRNVFIYFGADTVSAVAHKLAAALSEGGYLMTGHTELIGHCVRHLQSRLFAEGVVYQRASVAAPIAKIPVGTPAAIRVAPVVVRHAACVAPPTAPISGDLLTAARDFADRGDYAQAERTCCQALAVAPLAAAPHFLLAQLAQIRGDFELAAEHLEKTLYLDSRSVAACLELAALCERAGNLPRAQTLRRAALDIVRTLPDAVMIEPYETTAAEMAQWLA